MQNIAFINSLKAKEYTCILSDGQETVSSKERGVKPLYQFLKSGKDFSGFCGYDRVVGKATAFLYIALRVKGVYAITISEPAVTLLKENGIKVIYEQKVPNIINRSGTDLCPFEKAVLTVTTLKSALKTIEQKLKELNVI